MYVTNNTKLAMLIINAWCGDIFLQIKKPLSNL